MASDPLRKSEEFVLGFDRGIKTAAKAEFGCISNVFSEVGAELPRRTAPEVAFVTVYDCG